MSGPVGSVVIDGNMLVVEARPHVALQFRRMFVGAHRRRACVFEIAATPERAYDVHWFSTRYPLEVVPESAARFAELVAQHERKLAAVAELDEAGYVPREFDLAIPPREYQRLAADLLVRAGSLLIADEVGLGKSCTAICALAAPGSLPALVVTMTHLTRQWEREIARFAPKLRVHRIRRGEPYAFTDVRIEVDPDTKRRRVVRNKGVPDVLLINFHKLHGWADVLKGIVRSVIFDEAQELRHSGTHKYDAAKAIAEAADMRAGLTATPVYNYGVEIYNVMDVVAPGQLGTPKEFLDSWCGGGADGEERQVRDGKAMVSDPAALGTYLRETGLMIRRTRRDVGRELPELTLVRHVVEADPESIEKATADVAELARRVLDRIGSPIDQMRAAGEIDYKLRQATGIAKAGAVAEFVRLLVESGEKVVLYGWHHECFGRGTRVLMYDGTSKAVEDVAVGDVVMGPDSTPRRVQTLVRGAGPLWCITPNKGQPWICSNRHLLALRYSQAGRSYSPVIPAAEFAAKSPRAKREYRLYRASQVTFGSASPVVEPWLLGCWLGDGNSDLRSIVVSVADRDPEIAEEIARIADRHGLRISVNHTGRHCAFYRIVGQPGHKGQNVLLNEWKRLGLHRNKHVPLAYKTASAEDRRQLLAGLLDSDGHVSQRMAGNAVFTSTNERLAGDAAFVARSLGIQATVRPRAARHGAPYFEVYISGDLESLPTRCARKRSPARAGQKDVLHVGFSIESAGHGEFFGFETDGDHLFLLEDFTVVHNCYALWQSNFDRGVRIPYAVYTGKQTDRQKDEARRRFIEGDAEVLIISLRAGAGLDGLQRVSRTCVIGELDWSPAVIHQDMGRLHRDGQQHPVMAYALVAEEGSDPVIEDVLGIKHAQSAWMLNPADGKGDAIAAGAAADHVRRLAESVLAKARAR